MAKNKYIKLAHISKEKFRKLLFSFCLDLTTTQIGVFTRINRNTASRIVQKISKRIAQICEDSKPFKDK